MSCVRGPRQHTTFRCSSLASHLLDDLVADAHVTRVVHARHPQPKHVRTVRGLLLLVVPALDYLHEGAEKNKKGHRRWATQQITRCTLTITINNGMLSNSAMLEHVPAYRAYTMTTRYTPFVRLAAFTFGLQTSKNNLDVKTTCTTRRQHRPMIFAPPAEHRKARESPPYLQTTQTSVPHTSLPRPIILRVPATASLQATANSYGQH